MITNTNFRTVKISPTISLPINIVKKLDLAIANNPPSFKFKIEIAYYFLHLILWRAYIDPECNNFNDGFVSLDSTILKSNTRDYNKYFQFFIDNEIVEKKMYSTENGTANSFRFKKDLIDNSINFTTVSLEGIDKLKNFIIVERFDGKEEGCEHLVKWFYEGLSIDYNQAIKEALQEEEIKKRMSMRFAIEKIANKEYWFTRNREKDNRLHTPITNLSKKIRPHLLYNGQKMINIDIKSSQPYFLISLIEEINSSNQTKKGKHTLMLHNLKKIKEIVATDGFKAEYSKIKNRILNDDFYTRIAEVIFENKDVNLEREEVIWKEKYSIRKKVTYKSVRELVKKLTLRLFYINPSAPACKADKV